MNVRAKFKCTSIGRIYTGGEPAEQQLVKLNATSDTAGDNKNWSKWTPCGELSMTITAEGAVNAFELGKCYWVDCTPIEP